MKTYAIVPVKELDRAKSRLSECLDKEGRKGLLFAMLEDVLSALVDIPTIVISPENLNSIERENVVFLKQEGKKDLDSAVKQANAYALKRGASSTLFIPADMPLIRRKDLLEVFKLGQRYSVIITRSSDGGTGILYRRPPNIMESRFTQNSYEDHMAEAKRQGINPHIHSSFPLSLDIDTLEDLRRFMAHGKNTKTYRFLRSCGSDLNWGNKVK